MCLFLSLIGEREKHENIRRNKDSVGWPHFTGTLYVGELFRKNTGFLAFFIQLHKKKPIRS